jgi:hypothetical protein
MRPLSAFSTRVTPSYQASRTSVRPRNLGVRTSNLFGALLNEHNQQVKSLIGVADDRNGCLGTDWQPTTARLDK